MDEDYGIVLRASTNGTETNAGRPRSISISATIQILLFSEPLWRAFKLGDTPSLAGASLLVLFATFLVLQVTAYRKAWARNLLAVLAIGGLATAVLSGDLWATDDLDRFVASATSVPNIIAVALLFTPASAAWFGNRGR